MPIFEWNLACNFYNSLPNSDLWYKFSYGSRFEEFYYESILLAIIKFGWIIVISLDLTTSYIIQIPIYCRIRLKILSSDLDNLQVQAGKITSRFPKYDINDIIEWCLVNENDYLNNVILWDASKRTNINSQLSSHNKIENNSQPSSEQQLTPQN